MCLPLTPDTNLGWSALLFTSHTHLLKSDDDAEKECKRRGRRSDKQSHKKSRSHKEIGPWRVKKAVVKRDRKRDRKDKHRIEMRKVITIPVPSNFLSLFRQCLLLWEKRSHTQFLSVKPLTSVWFWVQMMQLLLYSVVLLYLLLLIQLLIEKNWIYTWILWHQETHKIKLSNCHNHSFLFLLHDKQIHIRSTFLFLVLLYNVFSHDFRAIYMYTWTGTEKLSALETLLHVFFKHVRQTVKMKTETDIVNYDCIQHSFHTNGHFIYLHCISLHRYYLFPYTKKSLTREPIQSRSWCLFHWFDILLEFVPSF